MALSYSKKFCLSVVSNYRASRDPRIALFRLLSVLFWIISKGKCLRETFAALFQSLQRNHFSLSYTIIGVEVKASIVSLKWNPQRAKPLIFWIFRTSNCSISEGWCSKTKNGTSKGKPVQNTESNSYFSLETGINRIKNQLWSIPEKTEL